MARCYVGTYGKYNAGSLAGAWLDLSDYPTYQDFLNNETRYTSLKVKFPERAERLFKESEDAAKARFAHLEKLVELYK